MASTFIESGSAATQDFTHWGLGVIKGGTGNVTSDATSVGDSVRSILSASGATALGAFAVVGQRGILADAGRRISFNMMFNGAPTAVGGGADFCFISTATDSDVFGVSLNTSLQLVVTDNGTNALATGTKVLKTNQPYRITIVYTVTDTTHNSIKVYINGLLEITATNVTLLFTVSDTFYFGWGAANAPGANCNVYGAHFYIDDSSTGLLDNVKTTAKRSNANGTAVNFVTQIGAGGSGYGTGHSPQVNERPLSITNGWSVAAAGSAVTEEYNIENKGTGDVDLRGATIVDYMGWVYTKALVGETGSIIVNGVSSNISITTSPAMFKQIAGSTTYPAGSGTDIGEITSTTVTTVSLYECGIVVAYIPRHHLSLTGVGS